MRPHLPTLSSQSAPIRILVVDDDEVDRMALRRNLSQSGMAASLDEATSAAEAAARLGAATYDCLLMDYHIPGSDAVSLLSRVRDLAPDLPIVVLTGRGDEAVAVEVMKAGAVDYLPKGSLTPDRLSASIRYALEIARAAAARRRAEAALREQEAQFRTLANTIPQLAWMATPEGEIYWFNDRWYSYTGTALEQVQGWGWRAVHHPEHVERVVAGLRESFRAGEPWEDTFPLRGADGRYRWFLSRALPMRHADGAIAGWFGTNTDISDRLEIERALAASEERFRRALEIDTVGVIFFTMRGAITGANDAFLRMAGYTREQIADGRVRRDDLTPPEFAPQSRQALAELEATGRITPYEKPLLRQDGTHIWTLVAATRLNDREGVEYVLDISAQKQAEFEREDLLARERAARAEAERATKTREEVLAILAHDLRNPLHTILGAASLLGVTQDPDRRQRQLAIIARATQGMDRLLTDLLDVARIESGTFAIRREAVDVRALLQEAIDLFEPQAHGRGITLHTEVEDALPVLVADRGRLLQLLSNLLGNALKFTGDKGRVVVRAERRDSTIQVSVADSGPGIPEADLPRVFDRFWQAGGGPHGGAGLGLAICKGIVEAHGGHIWAASRPGEGATFHFEIPLVSAPTA